MIDPEAATQSITTMVYRVLEWAAGLPPELFGFLGLMLVGWALKAIPWFPNGLIPVAIVLSGCLLYAFGIPPSRAPQVAWDPRVFMGILGAGSGAVAWLVHFFVLKRLDLRGILVKWLKLALDLVGLGKYYRPAEGDTEFTPKPEEPKKPDGGGA